MKILIADDDGSARRVLRAALINLGHEVIEVQDGASAIAALAEPEAPSLAILDWMMPQTDGLEVCKTIRQNSSRYVYVILLSARDGPDDMVEGLDGGADDFLAKPFNLGELRARLRAGERVVALQDDLLRTQEAFRYEAQHDQLTGLWNRGRILDELARELRRNRREHGSLAIILADVDHFKRINDTYGHLVGDTVLRHIGQRLLASLRTTDAIGRYGGEEFLLLLPRADLGGGRDVAERIRSAIATRPITEGVAELNVTLSLGVACSGPSGPESAVLVEAADQAMYRAKAKGRNRVEVASTHDC